MYLKGIVGFQNISLQQGDKMVYGRDVTMPWIDGGGGVYTGRILPLSSLYSFGPHFNMASGSRFSSHERGLWWDGINSALFLPQLSQVMWSHKCLFNWQPPLRSSCLQFQDWIRSLTVNRNSSLLVAQAGDVQMPNWRASQREASPTAVKNSGSSWEPNGWSRVMWRRTVNAGLQDRKSVV